MSLIVRIVRIHYVWLTMMRLVAVLVRLTEVALEYLAVSETRAVILCGFLVGTLVLVAIAVARAAIFAALFDALCETSVQSGLTQVE